MNYYRRYPAHYARDTAHLSLAEHGAYNLLLDHQYTTEKPLPKDIEHLYRICRARTKEDESAVSSVAEQFFPVVDGRRSNPRAERQIPKELALLNSAITKAKKAADARWNASSNAPSMLVECLDDAKAHAVLDLSSSSLRSEEELLPTSVGKVRSVAANECPQKEIISLYHQILPQCPNVRVWDQRRRRALRTRWREDKQRQDLAWWRGYFSYVAKSGFLTGQAPPRNGSPPFVADLEWLLKPANLVKVYEGKYHRG